MQVDLVTLDLSFISVLKVLPAVVGVMRPEGARLVVLIKPQFEAGKGAVSPGGVVRDPKVHQEVIASITAGVEAFNLTLQGVIESPLKGDKGGNTEFLAYFLHDPATGPLRLAPAGVARGAPGDSSDEDGGGGSSGSSGTGSRGGPGLEQ
jgi:23S rRNA (cytidine1920-2'-O)/16S rRNA (cytidine1409-2'-O)-methyltransferase